jgi:hypothetical protein
MIHLVYLGQFFLTKSKRSVQIKLLMRSEEQSFLINLRSKCQFWYELKIIEPIHSFDFRLSNAERFYQINLSIKYQSHVLIM